MSSTEGLVPLRVLHVEDSQDDVDLAMRQLRHAGYAPVAKRVESAEDMRNALSSGPWDVILSDCSMPRFNAQAALSLLRETALDIPFIIVSGTIAEETAAAAMRAGAHDFIRKDKLHKLGGTVGHELRERETRRSRKAAEYELQASESRYRSFFNACPAAMWVYDAQSLAIAAVSDAVATLYGYSRRELAFMTMTDLVSFEGAAETATDESKSTWSPCKVRKRDGSTQSVLMGTSFVEIDGKKMAISVALDPPVVAAKPLPWDAWDDILDLAAQSERKTWSAPAPPSAIPSLDVALGSRRVLLASDDAETAALCDRALKAHGCIVDVASTEEAARIAERVTFDVIVTDVHMDRTSVRDFLRTVRERDSDVPVVLLASRSAKAEATAAVEYGAFCTIDKPVALESLLDVIRHAVEMYRMARLKKQAFELINPDVPRFGDRAGLETHFEKALDSLWIAFQPIVSWKKHSVFGYEALVRSDEPVLARPASLFFAAERLGRSHELGRAIRARVARIGAPANCKLFVNVHADDLDDMDLFSLSAPLTAIAPSVVLEITERSPLERVDALGARLKKLRRLGFQIAVDDLGAGYAGLSSFSRIEPEIVKFDTSLIRGVDISSRKRSLVRSMLELTQRDLGLIAISEGVETPAERDTLLALGADLLQGYLFGEPSRVLANPGW
jgi:PAS domain S-box-containing protein